jgi:hypothetical protein
MTAGSNLTEPSFVGIFSSIAMRCHKLMLQSEGHHISITYNTAVTAETKLRGIWYFDENIFPRPNLANPYNNEPKISLPGSNAPIWNTSNNKLVFYDGRKIVLEIGNLLDFRKEETYRGISIVLDFAVLTPPPPLIMSTSSTEVLIGKL